MWRVRGGNLRGREVGGGVEGLRFRLLSRRGMMDSVSRLVEWPAAHLNRGEDILILLYCRRKFDRIR